MVRAPFVSIYYFCFFLIYCIRYIRSIEGSQQPITVCAIVVIINVMCAWGIKNKSQRILSSMMHYEYEFWFELKPLKAYLSDLACTAASNETGQHTNEQQSVSIQQPKI